MIVMKVCDMVQSSTVYFHYSLPLSRSQSTLSHQSSLLYHHNEQQMIWEVDETLDGLIDFDECQLTYHRNITDTTGSEPCYFFMLLNVSDDYDGDDDDDDSNDDDDDSG